MPVDKRVQHIHDLAYNLWWGWNPPAQSLFEALAPQVWRESNHNAIAVIQSVSRDELNARLKESRLSQLANDVLTDFHYYLEREKTWGAAHAPHLLQNPVAYFSPEFALHECLPIYSGGLGILAGDHLKSASDLGLGLVGIGLFYRQGYFQQSLTIDGTQQENYPENITERLPVTLATHKNGSPVLSIVEIGHSIVKLYAWRAMVGRNVVYLMDSNHPDNEEHYRELTARTYGGDITTRICQEIVMGIGGVRLLRQLGIVPSVYHLNEGHSAFLLFELIREKMLDGQSFDQAMQWVRDHAVFTTHTPVPAGHDRFTVELMRFALGNYSGMSGISIEKMMEMGRVHPHDNGESFCMTVLALRCTRTSNAVSELHGRVSRTMWKDLYPGKAETEVPIIHITNGVHILSWMQHRTREFWQKFLGPDWETHIMQPDFWQRIADPGFISDEEIWALRYGLRRDLVEFARRRLRMQDRRNGGPARIYDTFLSPDALTIGFARRFAGYKRPGLIFTDLERIIQLCNNIDRPVQFVFAGKAHPKDDIGKAAVKRIFELTKHSQLFGKVVFLENYDINVARHLISGCDVWLNNPRRPLEASGTSGQKTAIHGCLHFSILDGWWREAYDGTNGFAIGKDESLDNAEEQDRLDERNLYHTLMTDILPSYFNRDDDGIPRDWIRRIRRAMQTLIPRFNTDRMVAEYYDKMYTRP